MPSGQVFGKDQLHQNSVIAVKARCTCGPEPAVPGPRRSSARSRSAGCPSSTSHSRESAIRTSTMRAAPAARPMYRWSPGTRSPGSCRRSARGHAFRGRGPRRRRQHGGLVPRVRELPMRASSNTVPAACSPTTRSGATASAPTAATARRSSSTSVSFFASPKAFPSPTRRRCSVRGSRCIPRCDIGRRGRASAWPSWASVAWDTSACRSRKRSARTRPCSN